MTIIVGLKTKNDIFIGADSRTTCGMQKSKKASSKVIRNGEFLMGATGYVRVGQLLKYSLCIPTRKENEDTMSYLVNSFSEAVRGCFKEAGYNTCTNGFDSFYGNFIFGYRGGLYSFEDIYQIHEEDSDYITTGSGTKYALGSLYATEKTKMGAEARIQKSLEAAANFCNGCGGPFNIEKL